MNKLGHKFYKCIYKYLYSSITVTNILKVKSAYCVNIQVTLKMLLLKQTSGKKSINHYYEHLIQNSYQALCSYFNKV